MFPNSKGYVFFGGEFLINNYKEFLNYSKTKFDYILIQNGYVQLKDILDEDYVLIKKYQGSNIGLARAYLAKIKGMDKKNITRLGYNMSLYKINN